MDEFVASQKGVEAMQPYLAAFEKCRGRLETATATVLARSSSDPNEVGAASYSYMELMGLVLYCFMWQRILAAALADQNSESSDADYTDALVKTGGFFLQRLLPRTESLLAEISSGAESLMTMRAEQF
jgi:acyl-CoA dehydrogenase